MSWIFNNNLARLALGLIVAYFMWQYQLGQKARIEVEQLETQIETIREQEQIRIRTFDAEVARLTTQAERDKQTGRLEDEATRDPDGGTPSLGVRSTTRINADR